MSGLRPGISDISAEDIIEAAAAVFPGEDIRTVMQEPGFTAKMGALQQIAVRLSLVRPGNGISRKLVSGLWGKLSRSHPLTLHGNMPSDVTTLPHAHAPPVPLPPSVPSIDAVAPASAALLLPPTPPNTSLRIPQPPPAPSSMPPPDNDMQTLTLRWGDTDPFGIMASYAVDEHFMPLSGLPERVNCSHLNVNQDSRVIPAGTLLFLPKLSCSEWLLDEVDTEHARLAFSPHAALRMLQDMCAFAFKAPADVSPLLCVLRVSEDIVTS